MEQLDFNLSRQARAEKIATDVRARINADTNQPQGVAPSGSSLFDAVLDTVNPLQHIPGVSNIYQSITKDELSPLASMAGGFLFGGPIGMGVGAASSFIEILTGKSPAEHAMALFETVNEDPSAQEATASTNLNSGLVGDKPNGQQINPQAEASANIFAAADKAHHLGIGANKNTVEYASNIWTQAAISEVTGKYDNAARQNDARNSDPTDRRV